MQRREIWDKHLNLHSAVDNLIDFSKVILRSEIIEMGNIHILLSVFFLLFPLPFYFSLSLSHRYAPEAPETPLSIVQRCIPLLVNFYFTNNTQYLGEDPLFLLQMNKSFLKTISL